MASSLSQNLKRINKASRACISSVLLMVFADQSGAAEVCSEPTKNDFIVSLHKAGVEKTIDGGKQVERIFGVISVNGEIIGRFYENPNTAIHNGIYRGLMRYHSNKEFAIDSCNQPGNEGDFLMEVADVVDIHGNQKTNILFHHGTKPSETTGCVIFGGPVKDRSGKNKYLPYPQSHPLVRLRLLFYGTNDPISCPNKNIVINVHGKP